MRYLFLFILFLSLFLSFCAPKKVRIYEGSFTLRERIVEYALSFQGTPYKTGAKGPSAFDCSGFVHYIFKRFDLLLPIDTERQFNSGYLIDKDDVQPADLVFFKIKKDLHVGIMINKEEFVHVSKSQGVRVSSLKEAYWKKNFLCFKRVLNL